LKDAEAALGQETDRESGQETDQGSGQESSEANLAWLRDVKARLESLDGTEALIEGFGELSGRFQRSV
jgi:DNA primase